MKIELEEIIDKVNYFDLKELQEILKMIKEKPGYVKLYFFTATIPEEVCKCGNTEWEITINPIYMDYNLAFCRNCGEMAFISRERIEKIFEEERRKEKAEYLKSLLEDLKKEITRIVKLDTLNRP